MVTLTSQELDELREKAASGELPADAVKQHFIAERKNVFGVDHKVDRQGKPIEKGVGSPGNQTRNSIEAYKKYHAADPDVERTVARMEKELAEFNARRQAERGVDQ